MKRILITLILILTFLPGCSKHDDPKTDGGQPEPTSTQIVSFYFYWPSGSMPDQDLRIVKEENRVFLNARAPFFSGEITIDEKALSDLQDIIVEHDMINWNGFDEKASALTTANNRFLLRIIYDDQSIISACGDHVFPDGYQEAEAALLDFFEQLLTQQ